MGVKFPFQQFCEDTYVQVSISYANTQLGAQIKLLYLVYILKGFFTFELHLK